MNKTNPKPMFDFNEAYFKKNDTMQLKALRKFKDVAPPALRKELAVHANGLTTTFKLESDGEYYDKRGLPLTSQLELLAKIGNSKVTIHERKGI